MVQPIVTRTVQLAATTLQANGDVCVNVTHYQLSADHPSAGLAAALFTAYENTWTTNMKPHQSGNDRFVQMAFTDMTVSPYLHVYDTVSHLGTGTGSDLPKQVAACISLATGYGGRSGRGRIFVGCLTTGDIDGSGNLTTGIAADLNTFASDLITGATSGGVTANLGVYSRKLGLTHLVTAHAVDLRADTQRRRANRRLY